MSAFDARVDLGLVLSLLRQARSTMLDRREKSMLGGRWILVLGILTHDSYLLLFDVPRNCNSHKKQLNARTSEVGEPRTRRRGNAYCVVDPPIGQSGVPHRVAFVEEKPPTVDTSLSGVIGPRAARLSKFDFLCHPGVCGIGTEAGGGESGCGVEQVQRYEEEARLERPAGAAIGCR